MNFKKSQMRPGERHPPDHHPHVFEAADGPFQAISKTILCGAKHKNLESTECFAQKIFRTIHNGETNSSKPPKNNPGTFPAP